MARAPARVMIGLLLSTESGKRGRVLSRGAIVLGRVGDSPRSTEFAPRTSRQIDMERARSTSIAALALALGMHRDTVSKRVSEAGLSPAEIVRGYPRFRLGDALRACLAPPTAADPDDLTPRQRLDHYRAERLQRELDKLRSGLVPADLFHDRLAIVRAILKDMEPLLSDLAAVLDGPQLERARQHLTQEWPQWS